MATILEALQYALSQQQAGQFAEAERVYREVLKVDPNQHDALQLLGYLCNQTGRLEESATLISKAIAIYPHHPAFHNNLGLSLAALGRLDEAEASYRKALSLDPNYAQAHTNLGNILSDRGKLDESLAAHRKALEIDPKCVDALVNLGGILCHLRRFTEAIQPLRAAVAIDPNSSAGFQNLGNALCETGQLEESLACCQKAVQLAPNQSSGWITAGLALSKLKRYDESIACQKQAITLDPKNAYAWNLLGNVHMFRDELLQAESAYRKAIELKSDFALPMSHLSLSLHGQGRLDESLEWSSRAVQSDPNDAAAHGNHSLNLLLNGDFETGWREYEFRLRTDAVNARKDLKIPLWSGREDLNGKSILLYAEQGLGDVIQFIRYLPLLRDRGARVFLQVQKSLLALASKMDGYEQILTTDEPAPPADFRISLLSLPSAFGTNLATIPANVPYFQPDAAIADEWKSRFESDGAGKRIALTWAGNAGHRNDKRRSLSPELLLPILQASPQHQFYSLQKDRAENMPAELKSRLIDHTTLLTDFSQTAGFLANIDLLISVDTSVVHLAGALGRPVWVMLPIGPDWRWLRDRDDSPWYPTMRLFRQQAFEDWSDPIQRISSQIQML